MSRCSILLALAGVISVESGCTPELLRSDEAGSYYRLIEAEMGTVKQLLWHWAMGCVAVCEWKKLNRQEELVQRAWLANLHLFQLPKRQKPFGLLDPFGHSVVFSDFSGCFRTGVVLRWHVFHCMFPWPPGRREDHLLKVDGILDRQLDGWKLGLIGTTPSMDL